MSEEKPVSAALAKLERPSAGSGSLGEWLAEFVFWETGWSFRVTVKLPGNTREEDVVAKAHARVHEVLQQATARAGQWKA